VGDKRDRQVRLRSQREEADEDIDESAGVDPERPNGKRPLQSRGMHRQTYEQRTNGAPGTDVPEQQGDTTAHGREEREPVRNSKQGGEKALEEELIAEMYEMIL
jgi:hypothetical protein